MKNLFLLFVLSFISQAYCQDVGISHVRWTSNGVEYEAVLLLTDQENKDGLARVKYNYSGDERIGEFLFEKFSYSEDGIEGLLFDGHSAKSIKGGGSYIADNFLFINNGDDDYDVYTVDDSYIDNYKFSEFKKCKLVSMDEYDYYTYSFFESFGLRESVLNSSSLKVLIDNVNQETSVINYGNFNDISPIITQDSIISGEKESNEPMIYYTIMDDEFTEMNSYKRSETFPKDWIKEKYEADLYISDISFNNGEWFVNMLEGKYSGNQKWNLSTEFPRTWISENWGDLYITSIAYGNDLWSVVMSEKDNMVNQGYLIDTEYQEDERREYYVNDNKIVEVAYGGGEWVIIYEEYSYTAPYQSFYFADENPKNWITENWEDDYFITEITYGNGKWHVIMEPEGDETIYQYTKRSEEFPKDYIKEQWNENDNCIRAIIYGRE